MTSYIFHYLNISVMHVLGGATTLFVIFGNLLHNMGENFNINNSDVEWIEN